MLNRRTMMYLLTGTIMSAGAGVVAGQDYPSKPIRIITAGAGGGSDFDSRQIAQGITGPLGQPVIVDNRTTALAAEAISKAPPDGYSLLVSGATLWIIPILRKTPYDSTDFSPISLIERTVNIVAVHPSVPVKSVKELITLAKSRPGELNYSSGSIGGPAHLASELLRHMAGINIVHIPYSGTAPAITAIISGEVQVTIFDSGIVSPHAKSGKLRALAVTSAEPSALTPGLPTVAASGLPGYEMTGMTGIWAPAKTPVSIINRLNQEIVRVLNLPDVRARFLSAEAEIVANSPEQFAAIIKSDTAKISKVIKDAGIKVN